MNQEKTLARPEHRGYPSGPQLVPQRMYRAPAGFGESRGRSFSGELPRPAAVASLPSIVGDDRFRAHLSHMDRQHRRIFAILDRARYLDADDRPGLETTFNVLVACIRRHFADEESLLGANGFPDIEWHQHAHARLLGEVRGYQTCLRDVQTSQVIAAFDSIGDWFARHLAVQDRQACAGVSAVGLRRTARPGPSS